MHISADRITSNGIPGFAEEWHLDMFLNYLHDGGRCCASLFAKGTNIALMVTSLLEFTVNVGKSYLCT